MVNKEEKEQKGYDVETGYLDGGLPYAKIGDKSKILLIIEALSYEHKPLSGFMLRYFKKAYRSFLDDYTIYSVGRRPNLPEDYLMDKMAEDYAKMIKQEFDGPVDVMGSSTGGQIAHYLAAEHPETVRKLIIISAAYRISEKGADIERRAAEYFENRKFGKSLGKTLELIYNKGIKLSIMKTFVRLIGWINYRNIEYPNDFLIEVKADREMNFRNRLGEIKAPTLILSGEKDIAYTAEDVKITADGIPNSKLILYQDYGHSLSMVNEEEILKEAKKFLLQ
ncbi:MAG: alpha/beta fold hydrolase [Candidatus Lokiarchaeota archaeon]|nr:alpha/beta fold hydrolase [Candidatus Lokiarchaeota archaeon]MBD3201448.1 alpha/beta fold hydrolase [Candidatus Lokiarchaeota archaeon]